jgi:hypothetical protein
MTSRPTYRCVACGEELRSWTASERHSDAQLHHRIELVLPPPSAPPARQPNRLPRFGR